MNGGYDTMSHNVGMITRAYGRAIIGVAEESKDYTEANAVTDDYHDTEPPQLFVIPLLPMPHFPLDGVLGTSIGNCTLAGFYACLEPSMGSPCMSGFRCPKPEALVSAQTAENKKLTKWPA
jgi:hypothetical protein